MDTRGYTRESCAKPAQNSMHTWRALLSQQGRMRQSCSCSVSVLMLLPAHACHLPRNSPQDCAHAVGTDHRQTKRTPSRTSSQKGTAIALPVSPGHPYMLPTPLRLAPVIFSLRSALPSLPAPSAAPQQSLGATAGSDGLSMCGSCCQQRCLGSAYVAGTCAWEMLGVLAHVCRDLRATSTSLRQSRATNTRRFGARSLAAPPMLLCELMCCPGCSCSCGSQQHVLWQGPPC